MHIDKFYRDSFVLTASNLITGIIGFIFSILLSRELGAQGLGLYGLIMPVYNLVLCLACDGLVTALSKISAVYHSKHDYKNLNRTMSTTFSFIFTWSISIGFLVFICAPLIGSSLIADDRSIDSIRIICPAIVFVSLSAILKGYYYGLDKFKIAAYIDIVEKILRVSVLMITVSVLPVHNVKSTVSAAYLALTIGEFTSFSLLYSYYKKNKNKNVITPARTQSRFQLMFNVLVISCPLCLNGFISSILSTASALILPRRLVSAGIPYDSALALIGKFLGMALNITYLPIIIVNSMTTVLVPDLSRSMSKNDYWATENRMLQVFKTACLVGTCTLIINLSVPNALGQVFYSRSDLGGFIAFASISSILSFVASPTFGMLNGLGRQNVVLRNSLIVSLEGLVLIFVLTGIPALNIYGFGIMLIVTSLTTLILNFMEIKKVCELKFPFYYAVTYLFLGLVSFFIIKLLNSFIPDNLLAIKVILTAVLSFTLMFSLSRLVYDANQS
ncbi:MAG: stage V sporulation protein B [Bacillota bacterium]|nr:stage V sporulation protein B [Bacillota bacterium]